MRNSGGSIFSSTNTVLNLTHQYHLVLHLYAFSSPGASLCFATFYNKRESTAQITFRSHKVCLSTGATIQIGKNSLFAVWVLKVRFFMIIMKHDTVGPRLIGHFIYAIWDSNTCKCLCVHP